MTFAGFLEGLFEEGRVRVGLPGVADDRQLEAGDRLLAAHQQRGRRELPGDMPDWEPAAGRWAALRLLRACQFYVYRDMDASAIGAAFCDKAVPSSTAPSAIYSVDVTFRFLPDLLRLATAAAERDPLLNHLRCWCRDWPLSSVGIAGWEELPPPTAELQAITGHPALLTLYVDRVIATEDASRLGEPQVREAVRAALGEHSASVPRIHQALRVPADSEAAV